MRQRDNIMAHLYGLTKTKYRIFSPTHKPNKPHNRPAVVD